MKPQLQDYLNQLRERHDARRWWLKAIVVCAVLGGLYGASAGAAIGAVPGAAGVIEAAAAVLAVLCAGPGARFGFFYGSLSRIRYGEVYVGTVAAIAGALVGGGLATLVLLALGAILGTVCGWLLLRAAVALRHGPLKQLAGGFAGAGLGMFVGAILWAVRLNPTMAPACAARGLAIGAVAGPLVFVVLLLMLRALPRRPDGNRENYLDVRFQG